MNAKIDVSLWLTLEWTEMLSPQVRPLTFWHTPWFVDGKIVKPGDNETRTLRYTIESPRILMVLAD